MVNRDADSSSDELETVPSSNLPQSNVEVALNYDRLGAPVSPTTSLPSKHSAHALLNKVDVMGILPTGSGKTLVMLCLYFYFRVDPKKKYC